MQLHSRQRVPAAMADSPSWTASDLEPVHANFTPLWPWALLVSATVGAP